jgi:hypothetical protein
VRPETYPPSTDATNKQIGGKMFASINAPELLYAIKAERIKRNSPDMIVVSRILGTVAIKVCFGSICCFLTFAIINLRI